MHNFIEVFSYNVTLLPPSNLKLNTGAAHSQNWRLNPSNSSSATSNPWYLKPGWLHGMAQLVRSLCGWAAWEAQLVLGTHHWGAFHIQPLPIIHELAYDFDMDNPRGIVKVKIHKWRQPNKLGIVGSLECTGSKSCLENWDALFAMKTSYILLVWRLWDFLSSSFFSFFIWTRNLKMDINGVD